MAFPTGWSYRCSLTIDNTKVSGTTNLTNFPVLLTEVNFPSTIFDNTQATGADLRFTSDEAGTTELAFEVVNWDTTNEYAEFLFKNKNDNTTDSIQVTWDGQSDVAPSSSTVYLQIYNRTTEEWETKDSDNSSAVNTDFELTSTITANLNNYYDVSGWVACRVYQEAV